MVAPRSQSSSQNDDGRVARRLENRVRIVDALFDLIRAGQYHPTLKDIAEKAGVTPRTLLNHFPDVGTLLQAALVRGRELADQDLPELPPGPDPESRVRAFFVNSAAFYDSYAAIRWSTLTYKGNMQGFESHKGRGQVLSRVEGRIIALVEDFGVSVEQDRELRRALRMVADPLSWRLLRVQQKLSRAEAAASIARSVIALARDAQRQVSRPLKSSAGARPTGR
ncbi:MAG: TetR/AcrR family transcriptional regulator [Polyangiales bacterium]